MDQTGDGAAQREYVPPVPDDPATLAEIGLRLFEQGDRASAMPWIVRAADGGEPRACYLLGVASYNGDAVPRDPRLAEALLRLAAAGGVAQAASALATITGPAPAGTADGLISQDAVAASRRALARLTPRASVAPGTLGAVVSEMLAEMLRERLERDLPTAFARAAARHE